MSSGVLKTDSSIPEKPHDAHDERNFKLPRAVNMMSGIGSRSNSYVRIESQLSQNISNI